MISRLFSDGGAAVRFLLRALIACLTAFGLKLSGEQVAAVQMLLEAVILTGRTYYRKGL